MALKYKIIITILVVLVSFAAGRFSTPVKIKTETKIVTVEKEVEKKDEEKKSHRHVDTRTTMVVKPDGTKETTVTTSTDVNTGTAIKDSKTDSSQTLSDKSMEKVKDSGRTALSLLAGVDVKSPTGIVYGISASRTFLGPLSLGIFGMTNNTCGASVGIVF